MAETWEEYSRRLGITSTPIPWAMVAEGPDLFAFNIDISPTLTISVCLKSVIKSGFCRLDVVACELVRFDSMRPAVKNIIGEGD